MHLALAKGRTGTHVGKTRVDFSVNFHLGAINAQEEVKRCGLYKNKCAERLNEAKRELPLRLRLYKSIGFMSALLAAVLVL